MKGHLYRFTVEHLEDPKGNSVESAPLVFKTKNHDDVFAIVEKMKNKGLFDEEDATSFAIGIKLFSEVMLKNKDHQLFSEFKPHFAEFMRTMKKS